MAWQPTTLNRQQQEERRLEGCRLLLEGSMTQAEIARHLGVSNVAVSKWKQRLNANEGRLEALRGTHAVGASPQLSDQQWEDLKKIILAGAQAAGFSTERWTLPRIQQLVSKRFGVWYSTGWLSKRLRSLGLSVQRPTTVARKQDDALVEAWLRQDWVRIKKSIRTRRSHHFR
jgi:putative transposase